MMTAWSGVRWALLAAVLVAAVTVQAKHVTPPESILHMADDSVRDVRALEEDPVRFTLNPACLQADGKKKALDAIMSKAGEVADFKNDGPDGDVEEVFDKYFGDMVGEMVTVTEGTSIKVRKIAIGPIDLIFDNGGTADPKDNTLTIHAPFLGKDGADFQGRNFAFHEKFEFDEGCIVPVSLEEETGLATTGRPGDLEEEYWNELPCVVQALVVSVLFTAMVVTAPIAPLIFVGLVGRCAVVWVGDKAKKVGKSIDNGFAKAKIGARKLFGPFGPKAETGVEGSEAREHEEEIFHRGVRKYEGSRY